MATHNLLTDDYIRDYVESISDCKFISQENRKTKPTNKTTVKFITLQCKCGNVFEVWWKCFKGTHQKPTRQCRNCTNKQMSEKFLMNDERYKAEKKRLNIEIEHIETCKGSHEAIKHKCPDCGGTFITTPNNVLRKASTKCRECANYSAARKRMKTKEEVEANLNDLGLKWIDGEYSNKLSRLTVLCSCNHSTFTRRYEYIIGGNDRCSQCTNSTSKPAYDIEQYLIRKGASFNKEMTFDDLRYIKKLRYDFFVDNRFLIEYHGEQHYLKTSRYADDDLYMRDMIKVNYAYDKQIPLIIIPYTKRKFYKNIIDEVLDENTLNLLISKHGYVIDFANIPYTIKSA